ncbi:phospho-N-acetylmuramoyl-pentapeptide-transferase [Parvimonas sp. G1641]|jgi:phospho-N-acetylmuramoyl-pentapeptide-transferase|uniref:phospho-N-acetylmuramoyl-pentapeptide- transferase n=1 Tax=unclassified Parvimonas TaxID=1151464 RepID=UPI001CB64AD2|nr:phospho-N-acetylmuramoyl-pentapeptide-transferase [uncultured Parvimonas sp.]MBF1036255.1 phospho-N-acetylmuramoyl-pentapeptide-transferase [Parvimonas sp.]
MRISNYTLWSVLVSFFLTVIIAKYSIPYLRKFKLGQNIRDDGPQSHLSKAGTPTMGGVFFVVAIILTTFCLGNFSREVFSVLIGMLGFTFIGFLDDFFKLVMKRSLGLTEIQKLIIQFVISIVVIIFIELVVGTDLTYQLVPFVKNPVHFGWIIYPIVIFVMIGTANATNLTDGLDGLSSSVSIPVFLGLAVISSSRYPSVGVFSLVFMASLMGFVLFNSYPARVFMGDTGSMALGGAIATICILNGMIFYLPIIGGIYVIEALSVIIQVVSYKTRNKKRVFLMSPIHHHYELKGYKEPQIVTAFAVISGILSIIAVNLFYSI